MTRKLAYVLLWCAAIGTTAGAAVVWAVDQYLWRRVQRAMG